MYFDQTKATSRHRKHRPIERFWFQLKQKMYKDEWETWQLQVGRFSTTNEASVNKNKISGRPWGILRNLMIMLFIGFC